MTTAPTYEGHTGMVANVGANTVAWPTHQAGDIGLLLVECANDVVPTLSDPQGFTFYASDGGGTPGGSTGVRIAVFWCRATSASMPAPTIADVGDHTIARMVVVRGARTSGDPTTGVGSGIASVTGGSSSVVVPSFTLPEPNCLVLCVSTRANDSTASFVSNESWANFPPAALTEQFDAGDTTGNGGALALGTAPVASSGATGSWTLAFSVSAATATMIFGIKPALDVNTGQFFVFF